MTSPQRELSHKHKHQVIQKHIQVQTQTVVKPLRYKHKPHTLIPQHVQKHKAMGTQKHTHLQK